MFSLFVAVTAAAPVANFAAFSAVLSSLGCARGECNVALNGSSASAALDCASLNQSKFQCDASGNVNYMCGCVSCVAFRRLPFAVIGFLRCAAI